MDLKKEEKVYLLKSARQVIEGKFLNSPKPAVDYNEFPIFREKCGAFVTLTINDNLRGCIGYIESDMPLFETICKAAIQAAFHDPRFTSLGKDELPKIALEISVLSPAEPINSYDEIIIGKHGLIVEESGRRGLLLPQVATENNFTREDFLTAICQKAGLNSYLWQKKQINLTVFTATVFNEEEQEA